MRTRAIYGAGGAFYSGLSETYAVSETGGSQEGVQVMLTPLGARRLLGVPLGEIGDRLIAPGDLLGARVGETIERLQEASGDAERLAILDRELTRHPAASRPVARDLAPATHRLLASGGRAGIAYLAAEIGCSRKHLSTRFRKEFGLGAKSFARVIRFDRAIGLLRSGRTGTWSELAACCGYAD